MTNLNTRTILVVDSRKRDMDVFFATCTVDAKGDLVLRYASSGFLPKMDDDTSSVTLPFAVLVMGEYSARSSAGHAGVIGYGGRKVTVVGGLGKPFGKGGLKRLRRPISGTLMPAGCTLHKADGNSSSNCTSATAAYDAAKFMAEMDRESIWLTEGQSDHTYIQRVEPSKDSVYPEFGEEHQKAVFDPLVSQVKSAIWALVPPADSIREEREPTDDEKTARNRSFLVNLMAIDACVDAGEAGVLEEVIVANGYERVKEVLTHLLDRARWNDNNYAHECKMTVEGNTLTITRMWEDRNDFTRPVYGWEGKTEIVFTMEVREPNNFGFLTPTQDVAA